MCVCSAARPPGLGPDGAGSQPGAPEEVRSAEGGAEEVSDGCRAAQLNSAKTEACAEIRQTTVTFSHSIDADSEL